MSKNRNSQDKNYQYPIEMHWSTQEIIDVIYFFECIEKAYETGVERDTITQAYRRLKEIVPGKADERNLFNEFEKNSGYSSYRIVQLTKNSPASERMIKQ